MRGDHFRISAARCGTRNEEETWPEGQQSGTRATDSAEIERCQRTLGEQIAGHDLEGFAQARAVIAGMVADYNDVRWHSALSFLRPVDYYRGHPEALRAERRRKLRTARQLRKQENIRLRQRLLPWTEGETVTYPK